MIPRAKGWRRKWHFSKTPRFDPSREMKRSPQLSDGGMEPATNFLDYEPKIKRDLLATGVAFTPDGVDRSTEKIEKGGEGNGNRPLAAAFLSVRSVGSPARSLRAYLRRRMEQPATATDTEYRYPGAVRGLVAISLAIGSWIAVLGGAWLVARYIMG